MQIPKHKSYQTRCEHIIEDCFTPNKGGMESKFTAKVIYLCLRHADKAMGKELAMDKRGATWRLF